MEASDTRTFDDQERESDGRTVEQDGEPKVDETRTVEQAVDTPGGPPEQGDED